MALFARRHDDDPDTAELLRAGEVRQAAARTTVNRLVFLTDSIRERNEQNHYAQGLQIALGMSADGGPARAGG